MGVAGGAHAHGRACRARGVFHHASLASPSHKTIGEDEASGRIAALYAQERDAIGIVMSATECWTTRPDLPPLWSDFFAGVKAGLTLSPRDWRLITFIAAKEVPSTYCAFVYAQRLVGDLGSKDAVARVMTDFRRAGLSARDVTVLTYAEKVATRAHEIVQADIDVLRGHGFTDPQIGDIALCASLRCFFSRFVEATGAAPEAPFIDGDPALRDVLTVGRPPAP